MDTLSLRTPTALAALLTLSLLTGCGTPPPTTPAAPATPAAGASQAPTVGSARREVASLNPRVLYSHDQGLTLLDGRTGQVVHTERRPGFLRLNDAGDGRHVVVTEGDRFLVYDTGISSHAHGDHAHHYVTRPGLTARTFDAPHAGHVVAHDGWTTLFADGTGQIASLPSDAIADPGAPVRAARTDAAHHGVALRLADDALLTTQGTAQDRRTVQVIKDGRVLAETTDCPGVHGEATARPTGRGDVVLLGCTNGPVLLRDGAFHKVAAPDAYARTGNAAGSPISPVVLTDYKTDADADLERPTRVALVDTLRGELRLAELGSSYWFRSLARGPQGEGLVLTYDGRIKVIDPASGAITADIEAIAPWTEHDQWQAPGPSIKVAGGEAYVTDAANRRLVVIDLGERRISRSFDLEHDPVEMAVTTGTPGHGDHQDHGRG